MCDETQWWDDDDDEYAEEDHMCDRCGNDGRIPSPDYLAIRGINYVACPDCEHGLRWPELM